MVICTYAGPPRVKISQLVLGATFLAHTVYTELYIYTFLLCYLYRYTEKKQIIILFNFVLPSVQLARRAKKFANKLNVN